MVGEKPTDGVKGKCEVSKDSPSPQKTDASADVGSVDSEESPPCVEVVDAGSVNLAENPPRFQESRHRAKTASSLAYILVCALIGTLLIHYIVVGALGHYGDKETVTTLTQVFDKWLPVISGLAGGAVTYYFTREAR